MRHLTLTTSYRRQTHLAINFVNCLFPILLFLFDHNKRRWTSSLLDSLDCIFLFIGKTRRSPQPGSESNPYATKQIIWATQIGPTKHCHNTTSKSSFIPAQGVLGPLCRLLCTPLKRLAYPSSRAVFL